MKDENLYNTDNWILKSYTVMLYENNHIIIAMLTVHANIRNLC